MAYQVGLTRSGDEKVVIVSFDDDSGNFCDKCKTVVLVPTMTCCIAESGEISVCETCITEMFAAIKGPEK